MRRARFEFTVEPFEDGSLGPHVEAALETLRGRSFEPEVGPFGNTVEGDVRSLFTAMGEAVTAALDAGATRISLTAQIVATSSDADQLLAMLAPVAAALGARLVAPDDMPEGALPLVWKGELVAGLQPPVARSIGHGLAGTVAGIEADLGRPLAELSRLEKQQIVRLLDEKGAFAVRNAVDEVADAMGVSRVTVYNYLKATRHPAVPGDAAARPARSSGRPAG
jgi:uncharacterized protein YqgV (UPF0045/DUF77 family)